MGLLLALHLTVVAKVWINAVLIEDILDRWKYLRGDLDRSVSSSSYTDPWRNPPMETELVMTGQTESIDTTD